MEEIVMSEASVVARRTHRLRNRLAPAVLLLSLGAGGCMDDLPGDSARSPTAPLPVQGEKVQFYKSGEIEFESPTRLAVTPKGEAIVVDPRARIVASVQPFTGEPETAFRVAGRPTAVAALKNRVLVGNGDNGSIEEFDFRGHFRGRFGDGLIGHPQDLAVDLADGLVFVLDGVERDVKLFELDGTYLGSVVGPGFGAEGLETPAALAVDPETREILVSDYGPDGGTAAVKRFGYDGASLGAIAGAGRCGMMGCSGGFSRPQGMAVDPASGYLLLADALLGQVLVLDRTTGAVVLTLGSRDDPVRPLRLPLGVGVGVDGEVYVVSNRIARVVRFESAEVPR